MRIGSVKIPVRSLSDVTRALRHATDIALAIGEQGFDPAERGILYRNDRRGDDNLRMPSIVEATNDGDCEDLSLCLGLHLLRQYGWIDYPAIIAPGYGAHVFCLSGGGYRDPSLECLIREHTLA